MSTLVVVALVCASIPAALFAANLLVYRRLPTRPSNKTQPLQPHYTRQESALADPRRFLPPRHESLSPPLSVLVPARNEQENIAATLDSVLASHSVDFEIVVLDDHSTDRTAEIVREIAMRDARVRLEPAPVLPPGWCGKQFACFTLAQRARYSLLVFIDADVRLAPDALERLGTFMESSGADLASGVPGQQLGTFSERVLLPLIHFILLGFLPMYLMRWTRLPAMSAGCGQLFIARREAYQKCGGHSRLRRSLHDGIKLPRVFRRAGLRTEVFDATDLASCRMYQTHRETWRGLGKNATEGLAAPATIVPTTLLLLGGQVLPVVLLACAHWLSLRALLLTGLATSLSFIPRLFAVARFKQPLASAALHPVGILALLLIQWDALIRHSLRKPAQWKGRSYAPSLEGPIAS